MAAEKHGSSYSDSSWRKRRKRLITRIIGCLIVILLAFGGFCAIIVFRDAKDITAQSQNMIAEAKSIADKAKDKDSDGINSIASSLAAQISDLKSKTNGISWQVATLVPVIGQDIQSARTVVTEMDNLCQYALVPACDALAQMQSGNLIKDETIDLASLQSISSTLGQISPILQNSSKQLNSLPKAHIGKLNEAIGKIKDLLSGANSALDQVNDVAPLLPQMFGANAQPRTYLIVAQNNAELRSTGGFPGTIGTLTLSDGKIALGKFTEAHDLKWYDQPGFDVTDEERIIFGDRVGKVPADTDFIPDFSRASYLLSEMWKDQKGGRIDGVIAIDPVFLQRLLALTGGITASNGMVVDGDNAARVLMHDGYQKLPTKAKDLFFAEVAGLAFQKIMGNIGEVSKIKLSETILQAIKEHRFQAWMVNPDEQNAIVKMGCSGTLSADKAAPKLGVFVADDTSSKMSWYLSLKTEIGQASKNQDGSTTYSVKTTIKNNLKHKDATGVVKYITGGNVTKRDVTDMVNKVYFFAPSGGLISDLKQDGFSQQGLGPALANYMDHQVIYSTIQTLGDSVTTYTYKVTVTSDAAQPLDLETTPTAQDVAGWK
ncbi:DUF4012 domain-containing protein [Coriobacterium glomerans]|uniref:DUF4012 domain-containing protein n=1 Tax=Coriobacterium glomerans TaxID=33871 RepID=UPI001FE0539C|nr:DUF4012 domain-containing protein [Coriobacterium glomerans]